MMGGLEEEVRDLIETPVCVCGEPMELLEPADDEPMSAIETFTAFCKKCGRFKVRFGFEGDWVRP